VRSFHRFANCQSSTVLSELALAIHFPSGLKETSFRSSWDSEQEKWYFAIVDIIAALTESDNPQVYWWVLKKRLLAEGNEKLVSKHLTMSNIKLFEHKKIRSSWNEEEQKWYFSIVDVVAILTNSPDAGNYWKVLKHRLSKEGNESVTNCNQLKMESSDGKFYLTDVADTEQLLRLIQSIPSPKAEPFKQWLAKTGYERMQEIADPGQSLDRARENWQRLGRSEKCLPEYA
jgi:BRO family, N-terminal domain